MIDTSAERQKGELLFREPQDCISYWSPDPSRGWGEVHLSPAISNILSLTVGRQVMEEGDFLPLHHHKRHDEVLHIVQGSGIGMFEDGERPIQAGMTVFVGRNRVHGFRNTGKGQLIIFYVCMPPGLEYVLEAVGMPRTPGEPRPQSIPRPDFATLGALGVLARFCSTPGAPE